MMFLQCILHPVWLWQVGLEEGEKKRWGRREGGERREVIVEEKVGRREGGGEREGGEHMVFRTLRVIFKSHLEGGGGGIC